MANSKSRKEYYREWHRQHPDAQREATLKYRYGISIEQYDEMLERQGGACAVCGQECRTGMRLAVDHNRETGQVRGLLCRACNGGISAMGCSIENLERAIEYLKQYEL